MVPPKYKKGILFLTILCIAGIFISLNLSDFRSSDPAEQTESNQSVGGQASEFAAGQEEETKQGQQEEAATSAAAVRVLPVLERAKHGLNSLEAARERWPESRAVSAMKGEQFHKTTFYKADDFKYSNIRFDEVFESDPAQNPDARLISQTAYVADHILLRYGPEYETVLTSILKKFPELSVRDELPTGEHLLIEFPLEEGVKDPFAFWSARFRAHGLNPEKDRLTFVSATFPFDPEFPLQWALQNTGQTGGTVDADIDAEEAWDIQTGDRRVIVAVIDTGVDLSHPDIRENLWIGTSGNGQLIKGFDLVSGGFTPQDIDGHGTHVAGVIGATADNALFVSGVAWEVSIMPVKVFDDFGVGTLSDIIQGVNTAVANGASILNMSLGISGGGENSDSDSFYKMLKNARDYGPRGVLVVASAGNDGADTDLTPSFPAAYNLSNIISVAASDSDDNLAGFSNFGAVSVDLAAPGDDILSTLPQSVDASRTGVLSGTSMAAPHVAGVAALIRSEDLTLDYLEIKNLILNSVDQKPAFKDVTVSAGRLNAYSALRSLTGANVLVSNVITRPLGTVNNGDVFLTVGEDMLVDVELTNFGNAAATGVEVNLTISQGGAFASITSPATKVIGVMAAGESQFLEAAFEIAATALGPFDFEQVIEIEIEVTYDPGFEHRQFSTFSIFQSASVSGFVYDGVDGVTPIEGALIKVDAELASGPVQVSTTSAVDGSYALDLFTGTIEISAAKDGFIPSLPRILSLSPNKPDRVLDFELGIGDFTVEPPVIDVTMLPETTKMVEARITNTGTSPVPLFFTVNFSEFGDFFGGDQLYGLKGVGTSTPTIVFINRFNFGVSREVTLELPTGSAAIDFTYFEGNLWILTSNTNGKASLFAFDAENFEQVDVVPDLSFNVSGSVSVENVFAVTIPVVRSEGEVVVIPSLAIGVTRSFFFDPRLYRVNPDAGFISDVSVFLGDLDDNSVTFFSDLDQLSFAAGNERQSFFYGRGIEIEEYAVAEGGGGLDQIQTRDLFDFDPNFNFFFEDLSFPLRDVAALTYLTANQSLYILTRAASSNVIQVDYDNFALANVFDAPAGVVRLASGTFQQASWIGFGYRTGSVGRGETATLPITLNSAGLFNGSERSGILRIDSPLTTSQGLVDISFTVGDVSGDPGFVAWYQRIFGLDPDATSGNADVDGDGIPTALEYVIGTDPQAPSSTTGLPSVVLNPDTGDIFLKFNLRSGLPDGFVEIQGRDVLTDPWQTLEEGTDFEVISVVPVTDDVDQVTIATQFNTSGFFRMVVSP